MDVHRLQRALSGQGPPDLVVRTIKTPAPAVGTDIVITCPGTSIWRPIGLVATLVTSAAAANRQVALKVTDGTDTLGLQLDANTLPANVTGRVSYFGSGNVSLGGAGATLMTNPMPEVVLPPGHTIGFETALIDVADQWGACVLWVEEYLNQPFGTHEQRVEDWLEYQVRSAMAAEGTG